MPYTGIIIIALVLSSSGTNGDHDGSLKSDFSKESGGGGTSTKMKIAVVNLGSELHLEHYFPRRLSTFSLGRHKRGLRLLHLQEQQDDIG